MPIKKIVISQVVNESLLSEKKKKIASDLRRQGVSSSQARKIAGAAVPVPRAQEDSYESLKRTEPQTPVVGKLIVPTHPHQEGLIVGSYKKCDVLKKMLKQEPVQVTRLVDYSLYIYYGAHLAELAPKLVSAGFDVTLLNKNGKQVKSWFGKDVIEHIR